MVNHFETNCFGAKFSPISFTLEDFTVSPFLPEYSDQLNFPIFTDVNLLALDPGEVLILEFGQGLWFGN